MKIIKTSVHGWLDYLVALLLIASPWLFDFYQGGVETWIFVSLGVLTIFYSLITDYELGLLPFISMRVHLFLDTINAVLLASAPWIFGFSEQVWKPFVIIAIVELIVVLFSSSKPLAERREQTYQRTGERWL